jgi:putative ubiquitin-RnfH superfamily antitoxin RatB of RatAB toxin-antitoxin module
VQAPTTPVGALGQAADYASEYPELAESGGLLCNLPVTEDGDAAKGLLNEMQGAPAARHRGRLGSSGEEPRVHYAADIVMKKPGGAFGQPEVPFTVRKVLVCCIMQYNDNGQVVSFLSLMPVDPPRRVSFATPGVFAALPSMDAVMRAREQSPLRLKAQAVLDGKTCFVATAPLWPAGTTELYPSVLRAEVYYGNPASGAVPVQLCDVASRTGGGSWQTTASFYLIGVQVPALVQLAMENGKPARLDVAEIKEPALETFMTLQAEPGGIALEVARWKNRMLLIAKSRTLPGLLRDKKTAELQDLSVKVEQAILDCSHESELLKDKAQRAVEAGNQEAGALGADQERELSLTLKERVEIIKPILAAIKEEIANRSK